MGGRPFSQAPLVWQRAYECRPAVSRQGKESANSNGGGLGTKWWGESTVVTSSLSLL